MIEITDRTFAHQGDHADYSHVTATRCAFNQCVVRGSSTPGQWHKFSDVTLCDASQWNCSIATSAFEDVLLRNLKRTGEAPLFLWGCVFQHVKIEGRISGIKINRSVSARHSPEVQSEWDAAVRGYYENVDWAIDISEAKFAGGIEFDAVPGHLIRRDPVTQVLVERRALLDSDWRSLDFDGSAINLSLSWFLKDSLFDSVVVAARHAPKYLERDLAVLNRLRSAGIAAAE